MKRSVALLAVMALLAAALLVWWSAGSASHSGSGATEPALVVGGEGIAAPVAPAASRAAESRGASQERVAAANPDANPDSRPGEGVRGQVSRIVQGRGGGVVAGAKVTVFPWVAGQAQTPSGAVPLGSAVSGADGRFAVADLPWSMRFWGRIEAPGHATSWRPLNRGVDEWVHLHPLLTLAGVVVRGPAREPVAGIDIECQSPLGSEPARARADERGEFELASPSAFGLRLILRLPGEFPLVRKAVNAVEGKRIEIHLDTPRIVFGEVVDLMAGLPVAGASVSGHCQTDTLGHFEFTTSAREGCAVEVTAPGYASVTAGLAVGRPGRHRIALLRESLVTGRVHDEAGCPIAGASVTLATWQEALRERDRLSVPEMYGKCGKVAAPPKEASKVDEPPFHGPVRTDQDGRFRIGGVGAGAGLVVCRVIVSCPGFAEGESSLLEVRFPGWHADVEIPLRRAARLRGTVRLQQAPVLARVLVDAADSPRLETRTDALGGYLLAGIPAGDAQVEALVEGLSPVRDRRPVAIQAGAEQVLDFDLVPNPTTITGRVLVIDAPPFEKGLASAQEERTDGAVRRYHGPMDGQGGFRIPVPDDPAARYTLSFGSIQGRARGGRSGVRPGEDVGPVEVTRLCLVHAQLVDAATRVPLAMGRLSWRRPGTEAWQDVTLALGPRHRRAPDAFEVWLPWGLLDLRVEPASAEHAVFDWPGVTVADNGPSVALPAQRR
jgi:hypothetical protein